MREVREARPPPTSDDEFTRLYRAHRDRLRRVAFLITNQAEAAEEIVQDAFVQVHGRWHSIDNPGAYIRTTVVNLSLAWRRRTALARDRIPRLVERWSDPPEVDETWDLLARLPPDLRVVLVLRYYEDLAVDEIARILQCRPATVRTRTHRALTKLRNKLGKESIP